MVEKKQKMRFNDAELSLMKNTFAENDVLLQVIRKVFLQMDLTEAEEKVVIGTFKGKAALNALMSKVFNPTLDAEAPRHQMIDLWMSVDIKDKHVDDLAPVFKARKMLIELLGQQVAVLADYTKKTKKLNKVSKLTKFTDDTEEFLVNITARNTLITHVETMLQQLEMLAGTKDETSEETIERLQKNSNK